MGAGWVDQWPVTDEIWATGFPHKCTELNRIGELAHFLPGPGG